MECGTSADAAWLSIISVLVAFQGFSFAVYQAGTRPYSSWNPLLVHTLINFAAGSILWYSVGYTISFGTSQRGLIGSLDGAFFLGVYNNCSLQQDSVPAIPFAIFELMLAIVTPFMFLSAWAEKISILGALIVYLLWPIFVYYPLTHWIRGKGWLHDNFGVVDQSGSLTIHTSTGCSAFVFTLILRRVHKNLLTNKKHDQSVEQRHYQDVLLITGGLVSSLGWYAINVGTVHKFNDAAVVSLLTSHLSICSSSLSWLLVTYLTRKNLNMADLLQGITTGLVGVSACSGSIDVWASLIIGVIVGSMSCVVSLSVKKYKPSWTTYSSGRHDITYVHGVPGILAAVTAGLFTKSSNGLNASAGAFYSNGKQLGIQLLGVAITITWSLFWTYLMTWIIRVTVGFNSCDANEVLGPYERPFRDQSSALPLLCKEKESLRNKLFKAITEDDLQGLDALVDTQVCFGVQDFDKRTPLHVAASRGYLHCVKFLLRQPGVDIHARDRWRATPLSEAVQRGHDAVVQCLLRHGASWCEDGVGDLLCKAVVKNNLEELQRLVLLGVDVNAPNSDGSTALHVAASLGSRGVVQYLTENRADINAVDSLGNAPLNYSDMHEHRAVSQLLEGLGARRLSHHYSMHEICEVATSGNLQMLRHMVHNGATVCYRDLNKRTPLHVSAAEGHLDVVKFLLLQPGININARDKNDFTPLLDAVVNGHHEVAEHLKARGGTISEFQLAHLMNSAASTGDIKTLKRLIRWTGQVNVSDFDGQTPLHTAAMYGRLNVTNLLLKEGADTTLVNRYGQIPLQVASANDHKAVEKELRKFLKLTEEILADDSTTTKCYSPLAKTQVRKQKKESTSYRYAKRESWSSTDNSMEVPRRQRGHSGVSKSPHSSTEMLNLTDVRTPLQMNTSARPSFLRTRATIPNMSMKTREMAGGQADYV